jgi:hypothetical protein
MSASEPTVPNEDSPGQPLSSAPRPQAVGGSMDAGSGPRLPRMRRVLSNHTSRWIAVVVVAVSLLGVSVGLATSSAATLPTVPSGASHSVAGAGTSGGPPSGGKGSNARSGPAAGGASGTVGTVSTTSFTMTTSAGQDVTVEDAPSTTYEKGTTLTSRSAVTKGETVLVLGTTDSTTITATQVIVQSSAGGSAASAAAQVVPFQRGAPTTSKQVGQIPASYSEGAGTIVSGATANRATEAALAAYPGGVVDRVVQLSDGEFEVHYIGVNWPHHVFVNQDFQVVGAE